MKVTVLLRNDHEAIRGLFEKYKKGGTRGQNGKRDLFNMIRRELTIHSEMEKDIFYPALTSIASKRTQDLVSSALQEHRSMEKLMNDLAGMNAQDRNFDAKVIHLIDEVNKHIEQEEEEIFDEARKGLPEYRLEELGLEMEDRKKILGQLAA